jgi:hypothetical protein
MLAGKVVRICTYNQKRTEANIQKEIMTVNEIVVSIT